MKRFLTVVLAGAMALGLASAAYANVCALDAVPAATLLFPLVIYDYEGGDSGQNTLFAITNVSSEAQIVHITVWTDFSVAILDFNITLTGYDVQTMSIRDLLRDGILPHEGNGANIWWDGTGTSNAGGSPFDDGPYSTFNELWDGDLDAYFAANGLDDPESTNPLDCDPDDWDASPNNYLAAGPIPAGTLDLFEGYLKRSQDADKWYEDCAGDEIDFDNAPWFITRDSGPVWLYITADVVGACNKELPDGAEDYFNETVGTGLIANNVLIGDVIYLDQANNYSEADNAVHIEADLAMPTISIGADGKPVTFYHRYHDGLGADFQDYREPLPTAWAFRYLVSEANSAKTWIRAWKGGTLNAIVQDLGGVDGQNPADLYANSCIPYTYYAWDEDEQVNSVGPGFVPPWSGGPTTEPIPVPNLLPLETQEVDADDFFLVKESDGSGFGWMLFVWPLANYDGSNPAVLDHYQTWMGVKYAAFGQYTAGLSGAVMSNLACFPNQSLPLLALAGASE